MSTSTVLTWREWLGSQAVLEELFEGNWLDQPFEPTAEDRKASWELYTELRTRICTQPLHYRSGDEGRALTSLSELFGHTRQAVRDHGAGCRNFAVLATAILNGVVRPFTAKWHRRQESGELEFEYVRHEFRAELAQLQQKLLPFQSMLGRLAEGGAFVPETEAARTVAPQETREFTRGTSRESWWPTAAADRKRYVLGERGHGGALDRQIAFDLNLPPRVAAEQVDEIRCHEASVIKDRRRAAGLEADSRDPIGLAISGGGIRSSTFALGVLQRLAQQGLLREVDLLSTVSGGGYAGSFLSSYLNSPLPDGNPCAGESVGLEAGDLPFLAPDDNESLALRWIRDRSKYLLFGGLIRRMQIYGLAAYGVLINLFVTVPLIALAVLLTSWLYGAELVQFGTADRWYPAPGWPAAILLATLTFAAVIAMLLGPVQMFCSRSEGSPKRFLRNYERIAVWTLPVLLSIAFVNALPMALHGVHRVLQPSVTLPAIGFSLTHDQLAAAGGTGAALLPLLAAMGTYFTRNRRVLGTLMRGLFLVSGPLFFLTAYLLLANWAILAGPNQNFMHWEVPKQWLLWAMIVLPALYGLWLLNVNYSSPHRFYRNRLSEAYLIRNALHRASDGTEAECIEQVDSQKLSALRDHTSAAPYHLINTALNVPATNEPELRGRDCDFFLFSQGYCGSALTGYIRTKQLEALDWHLDLGTAMAISGAAAAPYMGVHSIRPARFLLTLLNIRLSYWLPNPSCHSRWCRALQYCFPANATYLLREMFGWLSHDGSRVNLSDGGHIENLGVYELLRRRCKFIIALDGEQDHELARQSLMRLIRYATIDLNADIRFPDLHDLAKDEHGFSASHFALGVIRYQPTAERAETDIGLILYVKSSLTGNEPTTVLDYQRRHSDFPHQTTADQFFEEDQFEAYRALGYHVASEALRAELFDGPPPSNLTIRTWFRTLAEKLLSD